MSDSILELIKNSARPFKEFEAELDDGYGNKHTVKLFTRRLSSAETNHLTTTYNQEFAKVQEQYENDDSDLAILRRNFSKQPQEKLAKFIADSDRIDYLMQASTELDDLPYDNPKVIEKADALQAEDIALKMQATFDEVLDEAIERRAFVLASLRASQLQNQNLLFYAIYKEDEETKVKERLFPSIEFIENELDAGTIDSLLAAANKAIGGVAANPLPSAQAKPSRKRTPSPKASVEE